MGSDCRATADAAVAADVTELIGKLESASGLLTEEAREAEEFLVVETPHMDESAAAVTLKGTKSGFINPVRTAIKNRDVWLEES